jgi:type I restriction enzyme S subunit
MRAWQCAIGASDLRGIISPAYVVMRLRNDDHNHQYFHHLYRTPQFGKEAERWSYGITSDMWSLRPEYFKTIITPLPPPDEQAAIVRFLNHTNQRIEHTIRAKRKVIALLNEQKQVIIHRAVTRGLDPNVRLKPSGIPWLGEIPEHWEVRRNGYIFKERNERGQVGLPVLIVSLRTGVTVGSETNEAGRERRLIADHTSYKLACQGDIAYNMMRMWQGAVGVVPALGLVSPAYVVAQPLEGVSSSYYELLFRTDACKGEINRNSRGIVSDRNRLYWDDFKRLVLPVPPINEQIGIVENLSNQFAEVDLAINRTEREIDLLREYLTRLIADVVTGKLDVREAAVRLPDDTDSLDDTDFVDTDDLDESCFIEGGDDGDTAAS